jgi:hypothetical protein
MKSRFVVVMALAAMLLCSSVSFGATYSDVETALKTKIPGVVPFEMGFRTDGFFHQDTFVVSDIIRNPDDSLWSPADGPAPIASLGVPSLQKGNDGYIVVNNPDYSDGADVGDRVVSYGAGNIDPTWIYRVTEGGPQSGFKVASTVKVAYGNLATKAEVVTSAGDTSTQAYAWALDTYTNTLSVIPAVRIDDANSDGEISFDTLYDFNVDEGSANAYFDRNRDSVADINDRAFMVLYEDDVNGTEVDVIDNPTLRADADGDTILVDNYWVGNPYAPMADADPIIYDVGNLVDPLLIGYLENVKANTIINLNAPDNELNQQLKFELTGSYDLSVVGGRMLDYYNTLSPYGYTIDGTWNYITFFDLGSPNLATVMEFSGGGNNFLYTFENPVSEPSAALLLLGSLAGVAVRKRRR